MRFFCALLLLVLCCTSLLSADHPDKINKGIARQICRQPVWSADLVKGFQYRPFKLPNVQRGLPSDTWWKTQQGVVFISTEVLAIFKVQKMDEVAPLASRDVSGGSGKFILRVSLLDTANGDHLRSIVLTTNGSDYSQVYATRASRLLIWTGDVIRVFSSKLEELASRPLPRYHSASNESWKIAMDDLSSRLYLEHYEYFGPNKPDRKERFFVNPDSLETIAVLSADAANRFKENFSAHSQQRFRASFKNETVASAIGNESLAVAELMRERWNPLDLDLSPKHLRLAVYDPNTGVERCSIPISSTVSGSSTGHPFAGSGPQLYAISKDGKIAVIQENTVSVYQP